MSLMWLVQDVAQDAVIAADGYTYERASIAAWLAAHVVSPVTKRRLTSKRLITNRSVQAVIASCSLVHI